MTAASYRTILKSSSIIGGASVINIVAGLVKMKAAALFLGPAGVGLIGLYQSLIQTGSTIAGLGMNTAGTRHIAMVTEEGDQAISLARRALLWGAFVQAALGALFFWLFGEVIALHLFDNPARTGEIAWLSIGVAFMVGAAAQTAILTGLRQIANVAKVAIGNGCIGAVGGILALWWFGEDALVPFVLLTPLATFLLGYYYVGRIRNSGGRGSLKTLFREWRLVARMGFPLMIGALVTLAGGLTVRILVQRELGPEALGHFQAAWTIGMTYLTFVLGAVGTDFFPRLSAAMKDKKSAGAIVNQQTEVAVLLCGPILVAMLGCASLVIGILYTSEFGPAIEVLRWQILGDILKVIGWPLGFILLASGAGKTFVLAESIGMGVFVLVVSFGLPVLGLAATGIGFLAMYAAYLPVVWWLGGRRIGFFWSKAVAWQIVITIAAATVVFAAATVSDVAGIFVGLALGAIMALWSLSRISSITEASGKLAVFVGLEQKIKDWLKQKAQ